MKIAIVGSGALGCYYGGLLARNGADIHFLMRSDYETVRANGLTIKSPNGDFHLDKVNCYNNPVDIGIADIVFIGLKTTANHCYKELVTPLVDSKTRIVTAQNGLGNEQLLANLFVPNQIAGALAFLCANRIAPGIIDHLDYGHVHMGNFNRAPDVIIQKLGQLFNDAGIDCKVVDDLNQARWKKLMWNIPFNGLSALLDMTVDKLFIDKELSRVVLALMKETQAAAAANGAILDDAAIDQMIEYTRVMEPYYTSMHLDRINGHPMEIDSILKAPLAAGTEKGIAMPELKKLYQALNEINNK
ncbi:MAG: 2-dehydropantoate 2-reductase [Phycisphaerae bacterium]|nr:2-dehydropantoate 2-reductase [Phycisphaerae bacterium]